MISFANSCISCMFACILKTHDFAGWLYQQHWNQHNCKNILKMPLKRNNASKERKSESPVY